MPRYAVLQEIAPDTYRVIWRGTLDADARAASAASGAIGRTWTVNQDNVLAEVFYDSDTTPPVVRIRRRPGFGPIGPVPEPFPGP